MTFCGNRLLVEDRFRSGVLEDCLVAGCGLEGMEFRCCLWRGVELREVSAPFLVFENADMREVSIFRSSLSRMRLDSSTLRDSVLDGLVLIRSVWWELTVRNLRLRSSCLQRAEFSHVRASSSSFIDFEALESRMEGCLFSGCLFALTFGSGMNGFSGARIKNCIFFGCRFEGFPLRGAAVENCLFIRCSGEISDEPPVFRGAGRKTSLVRRGEAGELAARLAAEEDFVTEEQIMAVLEDTDAGLVREALALFLAEGEKAAPLRETPGFGNFAQAVAFLKKNYGFAELDLFSTEADLVYVSTGGRRILLSDEAGEKTAGFSEDAFSTAPPSGKQPEAGKQPPAAGRFPGRFSWLEI